MTCQNPVKGRRGPTSLNMAQDSDPGVKAQAAHHQLFAETPWIYTRTEMLDILTNNTSTVY